MKPVGAGVIMYTEDVVLLVRNRRRRIWEIPGGTVRRRETVLEAAIREVREEVGKHPRPPVELIAIDECKTFDYYTFATRRWDDVRRSPWSRLVMGGVVWWHWESAIHIVSDLDRARLLKVAP